MGSNFNFKNFNNDPPGVNGSNTQPGNTPLARQTSVYSLTFDEFQSSVGGTGKDFGSMNMDELLKSIWSAEETQTMAFYSAPSSVNCGSGDGGGGVGVGGVVVSGGGGVSGAFNGQEGLQRQGSLTLPRTLSQKTVDEVWKDLSKGYEEKKDVCSSEMLPSIPQRQPTLGEVTLEEFLVRAGVVREENPLGCKIDNSGFFGELSGYRSSNNGTHLIGNQVMENGTQISFQAPNLPLNVNGVRSNQHQQQIFPKQAGMYAAAQMRPIQNNVHFGSSNGLVQSVVGLQGMVGLGGGVVAAGSPANQLSSDGIVKSNGDLSSVSPVPYVFNGSLRGRKCGGPVEKVVERRQRRMIKNRESAARSRARKQAYTTELEEEVAKLKEDNEQLRKKQSEIMEMQKNQVVEMMNVQESGKRRCLRRTQTGPW